MTNAMDKVQEKHLLLMAIAPIGIVMNSGMGLLTQWLKLPIYLDAIGTLVATVLTGIPGGIVTGIASSLFYGLFFNPVVPFYGGTQVAIAIFTGWMLKKRFLRTTPRIIFTGISLGVVSAIASAPVVIAFSGVTGTCTDMTMALLLASGRSLFQSVFWANFANEPFDKLIQCLITLWIVRRLPLRCKKHFPNLVHLEYPKS
ncbi:MAG: hypothetical protein C5B47_00290 [Verrucomicrobia bacterium]|nr:MAG: hypothetical protein C5B47_00290 [Verrucomicrobiota bacterium]